MQSQNLSRNSGALQTINNQQKKKTARLAVRAVFHIKREGVVGSEPGKFITDHMKKKKLYVRFVFHLMVCILSEKCDEKIVIL